MNKARRKSLNVAIKCLDHSLRELDKNGCDAYLGEVTCFFLISWVYLATC